MLTFYLVFCVSVFLFSMHTVLEDQTILKAMGDKPETLDVMAVIAVAVWSFLPLANILLITITILYRRGQF